MPALFLFLLKVNIALVLFCAGYYLVLRHLTFYTLNRIYLVTAITFSTIYPKINLSDFVRQHQQLTEPVQTVILRWETPAKNLVKPLYQANYWQWLGVIFWAGVVLFALRTVVQLFSIFRLYRRSQPGEIYEHKVRLLKDDTGPFSFWQSVYVNPTKLSPAELQNVLQHEQIHVSQWHTLDLLLAELSTIFYWFNPGMWLMRRAVRENLEFITDRKILQEGTDSKEYQYSLLSVSLAAAPNIIVNHFNISTIKKRIIMMNAKRSSGYKLTRYILLVPAVVVLLLTFSLSKAEVASHTFKTIAKVIRHVVSVGDNENPVKKPFIAIITKRNKAASAKTSVKNLISSPDTIYAGKGKNGKKSFLFTSDKSLDSIGYVINGVRSTRADVATVNPDHIYSVDLISSKFAKEFVDDATGKSDFLFVSTEDSEKGKELKERIDKSFRNGAIARGYHLAGEPPVSSANIVPGPATGTPYAYNVSRSSDNSTTVEDDVNGSKDAGSVAVTGVAPPVKAQTMTYVKKHVSVNAKSGSDVAITLDAPQVVNVTSSDKVTVAVAPKKVYVTGLKNDNDQLTIDGDGHPLFIIDGKETLNIKNLLPSTIKSITVLKDRSALKLYGDKGKHGVIIVTTKKVSNL